MTSYSDPDPVHGLSEVHRWSARTRYVRIWTASLLLRFLARLGQTLEHIRQQPGVRAIAVAAEIAHIHQYLSDHPQETQAVVRALNRLPPGTPNLIALATVLSFFKPTFQYELPAKPRLSWEYVLDWMRAPLGHIYLLEFDYTRIQPPDPPAPPDPPEVPHEYQRTIVSGVRTRALQPLDSRRKRRRTPFWRRPRKSR